MSVLSVTRSPHVVLKLQSCWKVCSCCSVPACLKCFVTTTSESIILCRAICVELEQSTNTAMYTSSTVLLPTQKRPKVSTRRELAVWNRFKLVLKDMKAYTEAHQAWVPVSRLGDFECLEAGWRIRAITFL